MSAVDRGRDATVRDGPPSPRVGRAKRVLWQLQALDFRAYLDEQGALLIADALGKRRDVSRYLPIGEVFDALVAGLAEDPGLLDLDTATAEPDLSDLDPQLELSAPELFEPGPPGLADDPGLLDSEERK
jgi:hypothetical protein